MSTLKIGVVGAGHLGKIHLKCIKNIPAYTLLGFFDADPKVAAAVAKELDVKPFGSYEELIKAVDVVDVVSPTSLHFDHATQAVKNFKHVFIEKPITSNLEQARDLVSLVSEAGVKAMVGHVERFNPALLALRADNLKLAPQFIEVHRLAQWNPRGTDVSVVLDVMIHDIDVVQNLVNSSVKTIRANGVSVVGDTSDIAHARIEFHNGCVANLTASRISFKNMRRLRLYQADAYVTVDFLEKKTEIFTAHDALPAGLPADQPHYSFKSYTHEKHVTVKNLPVLPVNSIQMELEELAKAILQGTEPPVTAYDGYSALQTAFMIEEKIATHGAV